MIPVSALVVTKNEAHRIKRCLAALQGFSEIMVIDSASDDDTAAIARACGARVENFLWNGGYPKKRQWCLDNLDPAHEWVFFVDADEVVTDELRREIAGLFKMDPAGAASGAPACEGYFVKGRYVWNGRVLRHGLANNKLALFDRRRVRFPVVDDLDLAGMGEIEGHYQPVPKSANGPIGQLQAPLLHYACEDAEGWRRRHQNYACWEAGMNRKKAWPADPGRGRQLAKCCFRSLPFRPVLAVLHSYVFRAGFLDGRAGWDFALSRGRYYRMIAGRS